MDTFWKSIRPPSKSFMERIDDHPSGGVAMKKMVGSCSWQNLMYLMTASLSYVYLFYLALFYPLGTLSFRFGKGLQRPFSYYLVEGFSTIFLASAIICKRITGNSTYLVSTLLFILSYTGSRSSSQAVPVFTTCSGTFLWLWHQNAHRFVFCSPATRNHSWSCCLSSLRDLLKHLSQLALGLT